VSNGGETITGYNVYEGTRAHRESTTPVNVSPLPPSATSYAATGLTNGLSYYFVVKAISAVGSGIPSNEASATPQVLASAPGAPGALLGTASSTHATLSWTAPPWNGGSAITGYNVYEGTTSGGESVTPLNASPLPASARGFTATALTNGTAYFFTVRAINGVGAGASSNQTKVVPHP
jgi:hypothetical protein